MHKFKKQDAWSLIRRYLFMIVGCFSYSLSLRAFLIPNEIVGGGASGAASLVELLTNGLIPAGLMIVAINVPLLIFGFRLMGLQFIINCFITTVTLGGTTELLTLFGDTLVFCDDKILAGLYGGILQGIGIGLFIKYEMSSGGTELLGRLTYHVVPYGSIATHVAIFDGAVVLLGAIMLQNPANVLYALILIFVSAKLSDMVVYGFTKAKMCYVITEKAEEISDFLISHSPRGVTLIQGEGMYSKTPKGVLFTCVKNNQVVGLKNMIKQLDENAFVIVCDANEVYGKGFKRI
ncbi:MAG: YitT family protein [Clostridia bacterium]|nr:YitT family protein [Clostridia bacterium]